MAMSRNLPVKLDPLRAYLNQIGQFPILTPAEERELAHAWSEKHDVEAARRLVVSNLRFVVRIARQYKGYGLKVMDLIQEGNLGLMVAVKRFNPRRGIRLLSYAVFWIRAYILSYVQRSWRLVRLGTTRAQRRLFYKLRSVQRGLQQLDPTAAVATPAAVGRALGVSSEEVIEMDHLLAGHDVSLDAPAHAGGTEDEPTLLEVLPAPEPSPEQEATAGESAALRRHRVGAALARLTPRERALLERRYLADEPATLAELAREQGLSRERLRQIEARALAKLKDTLTDDAPDLIDISEPTPCALPAAA